MAFGACCREFSHNSLMSNHPLVICMDRSGGFCVSGSFKNISSAKWCFRAECLGDLATNRFSALKFSRVRALLCRSYDFLFKSKLVAPKFLTHCEFSDLFWFRGIPKHFQKGLYKAITERLFVKNTTLQTHGIHPIKPCWRLMTIGFGVPIHPSFVPPTSILLLLQAFETREVF